MDSFQISEPVMKSEVTGVTNQCTSADGASVPGRYMAKCLTEKRTREIHWFLSGVIENPRPYAADGEIDLDTVMSTLKDSMNKTKGARTVGLISDRDVKRWLAYEHFAEEMDILKSIRIFAPGDFPRNLPIEENSDDDTNSETTPNDSNQVANPTTIDGMNAGGSENVNRDVTNEGSMGADDDMAAVYDASELKRTESSDLSVTSQSETGVDQDVPFPGKLKTRWIRQWNKEQQLAEKGVMRTMEEAISQGQEGELFTVGLTNQSEPVDVQFESDTVIVFPSSCDNRPGQQGVSRRAA